MSELTDLLEDIEETINNCSIAFQPFFEEIKMQPQNYVLKEIGERKETREIGKDDIPKIDKIINYTDNDFYNIQPKEFKSAYPELDIEKGAAIVEKVINLKILDKNRVKLRIRRYLLQEK